VFAKDRRVSSEPDCDSKHHRRNGTRLEQHEDVLVNEVRLQEELPMQETKVLAVSLDGVNVRLNAPGKKKGRPTERPKDEVSMSRETPSCFKNAMVGVCGLYGEVPQNTSSNTSTPKRLYGNCIARMPEDHAATFKRKFEAEANSMLVRLPKGVVKIVLMDGGRNLWGYGNATKLYDGFEKLLDFHHAMEHISQEREQCDQPLEPRAFSAKARRNRRHGIAGWRRCCLSTMTAYIA